LFAFLDNLHATSDLRVPTSLHALGSIYDSGSTGTLHRVGQVLV
jgi:hypothetical protein